ncbi:ABC transporter ATP-binding protein [Variovorax paradoxus]|uniref:ABC transporter ATP-binding protein n=1 Tax=Variovorax paradoxus TaxID=34073 RepID=UPI00193279EC|nr:ABC transporter ATP-binding protein [Variovorax paradoxus]
MDSQALKSRDKVKLRGVAKNYEDPRRARTTHAVEDFTLDIQDGQFICLLGPSGCGKSTVLNMVAGFEEVSAGSIEVDGAAVRGPSPERGMVFQRPMLFPWLTVIDNITFGPRMAGQARDRYLPGAKRYIELMGLSAFENHYPYELSGGMQQRVALARAWINEPKLILMDEPFGALDAQTRLQMQELLLEVWERLRTTVLFITHDIDESLFLADKVVVMSARPGRIRECLDVGIERPRRYETLIHDERFIRAKQFILQAIRG